MLSHSFESSFSELLNLGAVCECEQTGGQPRGRKEALGCVSEERITVWVPGGRRLSTVDPSHAARRPTGPLGKKKTLACHGSTLTSLSGV